MTSYRVHLSGVVSTSVVVEVDPAEVEEGQDPRDLAVERAYDGIQASLCHQCARHMDEPGEWHPGNWSAGPEDLDTMVEEVEL